MLKLAQCLTLISAGFLAACSSAGNATDGTGYALFHPNASTRQHVIANDPLFKLELAAHQRQCMKDKGCAK